ncbi:hypothetical protein [Shewanella sp. UCD-KL12]|uniref:hypothetical protein n=1 Tax=Shewanella sp. UCD-KL12 TaxID=1917163 RepID=UPI00097145A1|nr:hypothetical protein [Shewanella sp. UCD-KL12]
MDTLQTQHDIGSLKNNKNKPYTSAARAKNSLRDRVVQVGGVGAIPDDFHVVQTQATPKLFVIRHKQVCIINNITIEPFYLYGVEFVDTFNSHLPQTSASVRFDTMPEAIRYATSYKVESNITSIKKIHTAQPLDRESLKKVQRDLLEGKTIFELLNDDLNHYRQCIKDSIKDRNQVLQQHYKNKVKALRLEICSVEANANVTWEKKDFSLFKPNTLFPRINKAFQRYFELNEAA